MPRRPSVRRPRRRAMKKKMLRKARMNNNDLCYRTIQASGGLTPVQGVAVSNYVGTWWSPIPSLSSTASNPLFNLPEFTLFRNMYDQFRVNGVTVRLIPRIKTAEAGALVTAEGNGGLTYGKGVLWSVEDRDGVAPLSIASLKRYASVKTQSIYKTFQRSYRVNYRKANVWFDCQDPAGLNDVARSLGITGGITVYAESFPEPKNTIINDPWYDIEVKYYVVFKGKAIPSMTEDASGNVLVAADFPVTETVMYAEENTDKNPHSGAIDLSGNRIV